MSNFLERVVDEQAKIIECLTAERDALRKALEALVAHDIAANLRNEMPDQFELQMAIGTLKEVLRE